jgi:tight adherence protein C
MAAALVLGAICGLAVMAAWWLAWPPPPPLQAALDQLTRPAAATIQSGGSVGGWLGRQVRSAVESLGVDVGGLAPDLRITGRSLEPHLATKALLAFFGLLLPLAWTGLVALAGVSISLPVVLAVCAALAALGFVTPDVLLRRQAAEARRDFTAALGSFLDLVMISLAGGSGVEQALRDAARIGGGQAFTQLRDTLDATALTGQTPWVALGRLGADLGVPALGELAASVSLAGTEGARIRASLAAKAATLRTRQLAEAETEAQSATERLAVPTVLLLTGFVILIGYPAVNAVLTGL